MWKKDHIQTRNSFILVTKACFKKLVLKTSDGNLIFYVA